MQTGGKKAGSIRTNSRMLLLTGVAAILSGCMSVSDPAMFESQGFAPGAPVMADAADQSASMNMNEDEATETASAVPLPVPSPTASDASLRIPATAPVDAATGQPVVMADTAVDALNRGITQSQPAQSAANLYASAPAPQMAAPEPEAAPALQQAQPEPASAEMSSLNQDPAQAAVEPQVQELAVIAPPKKKSIFARMFAQQTTSTRKAPAGTQKRLVSPDATPVAYASASGAANALPGVNMAALFIDKSGDISDDSNDGQIQLASAAGLARLAPNGLHLQTEKVEVDCFKPELVRTLKAIERHYGRPAVVTSGYRSPKHNRRVGGASGSRHTSCEAADIQIEGVSKWQLAKYLRSMPQRGGVGTYCHTESVHIDIGSVRDWNWRCRRRK